MAAPKKKIPVLTKAVVWPREVIVKNDTPFRFVEKVKSVILAAHSEQPVMVSESEFMRIKHNFMQLNLLNGWDNGLVVIDSVGEKNGNV